MADQPLLELRGVHAGYGSVEAVSGLDLRVQEGECLALLGANGAGKSTVLRAVSGVCSVMSGSIWFAGHPMTGRSPEKVARAGVVHVPEGRRVFPRHTVLDNLLLGGMVTGGSRRALMDAVEEVLAHIPALAGLLARSAGALSGGESQMLAVGMGLMAKPRLLLLDEPSLGLAPIMVERVYEVIVRLREEHVSLVLVEQYAARALDNCDRACVLQRGRLVLEGTRDELRDDRIIAAYLGA